MLQVLSTDTLKAKSLFPSNKGVRHSSFNYSFHCSMRSMLLVEIHAFPGSVTRGGPDGKS